MPPHSWELSPATFLHHPVVRPIAVVDHQCDHTTMRSHHPRCTRSHTRSTAPVNSLSHSLLLSRANTEPIRIFRPDSKTIRIYGPRFTAKILRKCVSASNSPFSIIFCISETRFFRSTISILHSNLHRHCEVSGQRQISCVSAARARDCPREHSE